MDVKKVIESQYNASLEMLKNAIEKCPEPAWNNETYKNKFWHTAYHTLFYTHLYVQTSDKEFVPWSKHREDYQFLGPLPWPPHNTPRIGEPYSKEDILEYHDLCRKEVQLRIPQLEVDAESGFWWYPVNKTEMQFINIRHIQHHAGQLIDRLTTNENISIDWVGAKK